MDICTKFIRIRTALRFQIRRENFRLLRSQRIFRSLMLIYCFWLWPVAVSQRRSHRREFQVCIGPHVYTLPHPQFHPAQEGEEEEEEEGERGHFPAHLGLRRRDWDSPSCLETLLCADLREEGRVRVSDGELEPGRGRESLRKAWVLGLASFSETLPCICVGRVIVDQMDLSLAMAMLITLKMAMTMTMPTGMATAMPKVMLIRMSRFQFAATRGFAGARVVLRRIQCRTVLNPAFSLSQYWWQTRTQWWQRRIVWALQDLHLSNLLDQVLWHHLVVMSAS